MPQEVITGYTGTRHIAPGMDAAVWRGVFGGESCILKSGNNCAGSMPSVNQFTVRDGVVSIQGYLGYGTTETLPIDTCATGFRRVDLICARYTHDVNSLIDQVAYVVIKGTEVAAPNVPPVPAWNTGILADGATVADLPLYKVTLDGGAFTVEQMAPVRKTLADYPIGAVHVTSSNTSPAAYLGGTWDLIAKAPKEKVINMEPLATWNENVGASRALVANTSETGLTVYLRFMNNIALTENTFEICRVPLNALGLSSVGVANTVLYSDAGNGIVFMQTLINDNNIVFQSADVMVRGSATASLQANSQINGIFPVRVNEWLDSACDRFYWKRTA